MNDYEWGHADGQEREVVADLLRRIVPEESPTQDILDLALLLIEPCHREHQAIPLIEAVLKRAPSNGRAKILLAHCCIGYLVERPALKRAKALLASVIDTDPEYRGAAYMLLAEALYDMGKLPIGKEIRMLESSVACEPEWVYNRYRLAGAYKRVGRFSDAVDQMQRAVANIKDADPQWTLSDYYFESIITGRVERDFIESELQRMLRENCGQKK
jgi:thioredoxin-like negative regulator of GroEL